MDLFDSVYRDVGCDVLSDIKFEPHRTYACDIVSKMKLTDSGTCRISF